MSELRLFGLLSSLFLGIFIVWQYRLKRLRRSDLLLGGFIVGTLGMVSLYPPVLNEVTLLFGAQTRPMALAIIAIIVLFALFIYIQKELVVVRHSVGDLVRALARAEYQQLYGVDSHSGIIAIIPAFNEERNLEQILPMLPAEVCGLPLQALVIVDGAKDCSATVARRYNVPTTSHAINRGQGDALRTGFDLALQSDAAIIVTMDADGQHRPEEIERLVTPILANEADYVMGSRFAGHYADQGGARHLGILGFSALISLLSHTQISDCTNGFRAIRASSLAQIELQESRFSAPELIMEAVNKGLRIKEVPVSVLVRHEGESKKPRGWRYPLGFAWTILKVWLR